MGDGEIAEGAVWEAASLAGIYKLTNLVAIVDANRLGQSQATVSYTHLSKGRRSSDSANDLQPETTRDSPAPFEGRALASFSGPSQRPHPLGGDFYFALSCFIVF